MKNLALTAAVVLLLLVLGHFAGGAAAEVAYPPGRYPSNWDRNRDEYRYTVVQFCCWSGLIAAQVVFLVGHLLPAPHPQPSAPPQPHTRES